MTMPPEHAKAKAYLLEKGTQAPVTQIRERVADAFAALESLLDGVSESQAQRAPGARMERARDPGPPGRGASPRARGDARAAREPPLAGESHSGRASSRRIPSA